ncbi:hypothetical protein KPH14_012901, partial [Odynerus spinipes]
MAGGVAIYERKLDSDALNSRSQPLIRINKEKTGLEECNVISTDIGDICKAETTIDGERVLLIATYLSNGTTLNNKIKFMEGV